MSKSTTRSGGYRREYSAELRASMAKCSNSSRRGRRHLGVVAVTLVAVLVVAGVGGMVYLNQYEPEATAKATPTVKLATSANESDASTKSTTLIPYNTTSRWIT